jgi:hypothetical protein
MLTPGCCLVGLDDLGLDPEARQAFLQRTAHRAFAINR